MERDQPPADRWSAKGRRPCSTVAGRCVVIAALLVAGAFAALVAGPPAYAEAAAPAPATALSPDADARLTRLRQMLATPEGQEILDLLRTTAPTPAKPSDVAPTTFPSAGETLGRALADLRTRLVDLGRSVATLRHDAASIEGRLGQADDAPAARSAALFVILFLIGGIGLEALFFRITAEWRHHVGRAALRRVRERALIAGQRLLYALLLLVCFSAGSLGPYLLFRWPPPLGTIILDYLIALALVRLCLVLTRFIFAPGAERLRLVPLSTPDAVFWHRSLGIGVGLGAFGGQTISILGSLGLAEADIDSLQLLLGLFMATSGVCLVWTAFLLGHFGHTGRLRRNLVTSIVTLGLPFVWLAFAAKLDDIGWLLVALGLLPVAVPVARHGAAAIVRSHDPEANDPRIGAVLERAARTLVLVIIALALAHAWRLDVTALASGDSAASRLARGVLEAVVILLAADLAWHVVRVFIDHRLEAPEASAGLDEAEAYRHARVRTLLPVARSALLILLLAVASLSALSALGLQIGPLLAGAGIVGIAVGLGAQALVRDVISGIFFLLDDAFRVGEFVETGAISGTVEVFSLRSIKLRHYKGQLHTIPFGDMKMVTNYSRTWSAADLEVVVGYGVDLGLLDRTIAEVSQTLMLEPELAGSIIEPLSSLGITAMTESGLKVVMTIKVKAGQQFTARRLAYAWIKTLFDEHGIVFAVPRLSIAHDAAGARAAHPNSEASPPALP